MINTREIVLKKNYVENVYFVCSITLFIYGSICIKKWWMTSQHVNTNDVALLLKILWEDSRKRYLCYDLDKILNTDLSDTTKIFTYRLSFQDLMKILRIGGKISRSCLQDVRLGRDFLRNESEKYINKNYSYVFQYNIKEELL